MTDDGAGARDLLVKDEEETPMNHQSAPANSTQAFKRTKSSSGSPLTPTKSSISRDRRRIKEMLLTERCRGGWPKGHRKLLLEIYAGFLVGAGYSKDDAHHDVTEMAARCRPPYPDDRLRSGSILCELVEQAFAGVVLNYSTDDLCSLLGVTAETAREYDFKGLVPEEVRRERRISAGK